MPSNDTKNETGFTASGVGFPYGSAKPDGAAIAELEQYYSVISRFVAGTSNRLVIKGHASAPGADQYNKNLSQKRGEWLRDWLVKEKGIDPDRISVIPMGETPVHLTIDSSLPDRPDNPEDRVAVISVVTEQPEEVLTDVQEKSVERQEDTKEDFEEGKDLFESVTDDLDAAIRDVIDYEENPFGERPSADPEVFAGQAKDKISEAKDAAAKGGAAVFKLLAGQVIGGVVEVSIAQGASKLRAAREPLYIAMAEGVAAGIDSSYEPQGYAHWGQTQKKVFEGTKSEFSKLSQLQKYQTALFLIRVQKGQFIDAAVTKGNFMSFFESGDIADAARQLFKLPRYSTAASDGRPDNPVDLSEEAAADEAQQNANPIAAQASSDDHVPSDSSSQTDDEEPAEPAAGEPEEEKEQEDQEQKDQEQKIEPDDDEPEDEQENGPEGQEHDGAGGSKPNQEEAPHEESPPEPPPAAG
ncbi:MAG: OmpA family protein [Gammaproteobacteria bacterium]|nr:OmpA family protein [Gammaproteobacteria bacterium]